MAYTAWSVVFGEQPTAAKWNQLGANDAGFKDGTNIDAGAIITAKLADDGVTPAKLNFGIPTSLTGLSLTSSSTSFVDFAGTNSITITTNAGGAVLVLFSSQMTGADQVTSVAMSGANTAASSDEDAAYNASVNSVIPNYRLFTGLSAGSTTFKLQGKSNSGASRSWIRGKMSIIPLQ